MDEESRHVSLRLWDVLQQVGVTDRMRQLHRDTGIQREILWTVISNMVGLKQSYYTFGSASEGTTTPDMDRDHDMVICHEQYPVIDDIRQAPPGKPCLLMIAHNHTRPGYFKLQNVHDKTPCNIHNSFILDNSLCMSDCDGRLCFKHITRLGINKDVRERNGPADTTDIPGYNPTDWVYAFRSRIFPCAATESLLECIRSGWLTRENVENMIGFGCLFVGVGHPSSEEKDIEWRVSFSLQERYLMLSLNATQHACYVLLKLIKNMLTSKPDVGKSITSYHCKLCLFRVIKKIKSEQWTPVNLIDCTLLCLTELCQCLYDGNLPNFFIKTNNMFELRVYGEVKERLIHYLSTILNERFSVFYCIQSDSIGDSLRGQVCRHISNHINFSVGKHLYALYRNVWFTLSSVQSEMCVHMNSLSNTDLSLFLCHQLRYLSSVHTITEHTQSETKYAITYLKPVLHKLYAQHLATRAFCTEVHISRHYLLQASAFHLRQGMIWDLMSGRLTYATILYRQGNMEMCCDLLAKIKQNLIEEVISVCGCRMFPHTINIPLLRTIHRGTTDPWSMMRSYAAICTVFLSSHSEIIPKALQYELYRSLGAPPGLQTISHSKWYSLIVVDSKVYLYFLQYLVYSNQNKHRAKRVAIKNLYTVLQEDPNLGHKETGYNLLGWIYTQEGLIQAAEYCFVQSWVICPHYNAAKWHMLNLFYQQHVARR